MCLRLGPGPLSKVWSSSYPNKTLCPQATLLTSVECSDICIWKLTDDKSWCFYEPCLPFKQGPQIWVRLALWPWLLISLLPLTGGAVKMGGGPSLLFYLVFHSLSQHQLPPYCSKHTASLKATLIKSNSYVRETLIYLQVVKAKCFAFSFSLSHHIPHTIK